jgi:hypothetical protein
LTPDIDYFISIDNTNSIVRIVPVQGIWSYATYTINIANGNSAAPIKDLAGNVLQPNEASGATQFIIQQSETAISPWQNPVNQFDVNNSGTVSGLDALQVINRILLGQIGPLPSVATVPPYIDVNGDGSLTASDALAVISFLLSPPPASPLTALQTTTETVGAEPSAALPTEETSFTGNTIVASPAASTAAVASANPVATGLAISQMSSLADDSAETMADDSAAYVVGASAGSAAQSPGPGPAVAPAVTASFESSVLGEDED